MKRITSVSLVVAAFAAVAVNGCAAPVEPAEGAGSTSQGDAQSRAAAVMAATPKAEAPKLGAPKPEMSMPTVYTRWVAFQNDWSQTYGAGAGGVANFSFPFPTPWLSMSPETGYVADFDAFVYEHDLLMPIVSANSAPAYDPYQWWVAEITVETCEIDVGYPTIAPLTGPCIASFNSSLLFLVPFTDTTQEGTLENVEASYIGAQSDVQAALALRPIIYQLSTNSSGNYVTGTGPGGTTNYLLNPQPVAEYPYADVHDPHTPPI